MSRTRARTAPHPSRREQRGHELRHLPRHARAGNDQVEAGLLGPARACPRRRASRSRARGAPRPQDGRRSGVRRGPRSPGPLGRDCHRRRATSVTSWPGGRQRRLDLGGEEQVRRERERRGPWSDPQSVTARPSWKPSSARIVVDHLVAAPASPRSRPSRRGGPVPPRRAAGLLVGLAADRGRGDVDRRARPARCRPCRSCPAGPK